MQDYYDLDLNLLAMQYYMMCLSTGCRQGGTHLTDSPIESPMRFQAMAPLRRTMAGRYDSLFSPVYDVFCSFARSSTIPGLAPRRTGILDHHGVPL